jgi:hypothetical protein
MPAHKLPPGIREANHRAADNRWRKRKYATDEVFREAQKKAARIRDRQRYRDFLILKSLEVKK